MHRLRVVTWNIAAARVPGGGRDLGAVAGTLRELDADLVALQEVDRGHERSGGTDQAAAVAEALGMAWWFAPALLFDGPGAGAWHPADPGGADPGGPAYGVALLSRLPLEGARRLTLPPGPSGSGREPRVALVAAVEFGGQPLTVAATHLDTTMTRAAVQLRQVQGRLGGEPGPRVLLGDLNLRATALALAGRRGWRPAVRARTFPSWRPDRQLDHVLLSGAVGVQAGRAVRAAVSDHLALVADLQVPAGP